MINYLLMTRWSPYVVGGGIGLLSCAVFLLSDRPLGCSTAYVRTAGMIEKLLMRREIDKKEYFAKFPPVMDWGWMLVVGVIIGSFLSAILSGTFEATMIPQVWRYAFGSGALPRTFTALIGGVLMGFGARWADGCTSGHGISGTLQLVLSSWIAVAMFFIGGVLTALLLFST